MTKLPAKQEHIQGRCGQRPGGHIVIPSQLFNSGIVRCTQCYQYLWGIYKIEEEKDLW